MFNPKSNGFHFCECHTVKFFEGKLSFGRIDEDPPEEPIISDILGNKIRYYWLKDSEGMKKDDIFLKEEEEKQENYSKEGERKTSYKKDFIQRNRLAKVI